MLPFCGRLCKSKLYSSFLRQRRSLRTLWGCWCLFPVILRILPSKRLVHWGEMGVEEKEVEHFQGQNHETIHFLFINWSSARAICRMRRTKLFVQNGKIIPSRPNPLSASRHCNFRFHTTVGTIYLHVSEG